jgi:group I intron endonuclease
MIKKYYYIYITFNLINNKIYVGKRGCDCLPEDDIEYLGSGSILFKALRKYGKENFKKEILEVCEKSVLNEKERYYISLFKANKRDIGYNLTSGGEDTDGWTYFSEEQRESIRQLCSLKTKELWKDENYRKKVVESAMLAQQTATYKQNASVSQKKRWENDVIAKEAMSKRSFKRWANPEFRERMVNFLRSQTNEDKNITKKIYSVDIDTKEIILYNSIKEAVNKFKFRTNTIINCCRGKFGYYRGYIFIYEKDKEKLIDLYGFVNERFSLGTIGRKLNGKKIKVVANDETIYFNNMQEAADKLNLSYAMIWKTINKKIDNRYKGYSFYEV